MIAENPNSQLIWNTIKEIMKNDNNISFSESSGVYSIVPLSIRWKNFFLNNLFWGYTGEHQKNMIVLSDEIIKITDMIQSEVMDIEEYVKALSKLNFSIYLTDCDANRKELQNRVNNDTNYAIITQSGNKVEEFITNIAAKLFFINKGYLTGEFTIPSPECGIADIIGIKGDFVNVLKSKGIIPNGGDESDVLIWQELKNASNNSDEQTETIVCEVKSSSAWNTAYQQLYERTNNSQKPGYLKSHCFNKGYACFATPLQNEFEKEVEMKKVSCNGLKYEAGSLIFVSNKEPIFNEDPICLNPSNYRRNKTLSVLEGCQKELIELANKRIARIMISNICAIKVFENINQMRINNIFREIDNICVEDVLTKIG